MICDCEKDISEYSFNFHRTRPRLNMFEKLNRLKAETRLIVTFETTKRV